MADRDSKLSQRLVLEAPERVADGGGGWQVTWSALGTHWAELRTMSARERMSGEREISRVTHRVTVRSAPVGSARRPAPQQRFRQGERIFAIRGVAEADHRGAYLTCWVEEVPFA
ncbi:MAG TPA: head-tail adaptor protein [Thermohalobaculum sp.]|nr:head-tail adaptor protein [Thermohalobaculum sp.]